MIQHQLVRSEEYMPIQSVSISAEVYVEVGERSEDPTLAMKQSKMGWQSRLRDLYEYWLIWIDHGFVSLNSVD